METKFTPGPWEVDEGPDGLLQITAWEDGVRCIPARILGDPTYHSIAPNAHLIAAAPEMYAAATQLLTSLNLNYGNEDLVTTAERVGIQHGNATANAWLDLAQAIAKARGES